MREASQLLSPAAAIAEALHGLPNSDHGCAGRHDDARDDLEIVDAWKVHGLPARIEGVSQIAVSEVFHVCKTRSERVGNSYRLRERHGIHVRHFGSPSYGLVVAVVVRPDEGSLRHHDGSASKNSLCYTNVNGCGFRDTNAHVKRTSHSLRPSSRVTSKPAGNRPFVPAGINSSLSASLAGSGGNPGKPSSHAGGAKMAGPDRPDRPDVMSASKYAEWEQAASNSQVLQ